jgi:hypothetical protein
MASISAMTFAFLRNETNNVVVLESLHGKFRLDLHARKSFRHGGGKELPRKITDAMILACIRHDEEFPNLRRKWKTKWPA